MFGDRSVWIGCGEGEASPLIRRTFQWTGGRAELAVTGLGFFECFLNGRRVGEDWLKPAFSDYRERNFKGLLYPFTDETAHRIYYLVYDVTELLRPGKNVLALLLGDGWYRQNRRVDEGQMFFGRELMARYELTEGEKLIAASDGSERFAESFVKKSSLFFGEMQDFSHFDPERLLPDFDDSAWEPVRVLLDFETRFCRQSCPCDRVSAVLEPKLLAEREGVRIYDAGENLAGRVRIRSGGGDLSVRYAELYDGQKLDFSSCGGESQIQHDRFLAVPKGREVFPVFRWSGFRFFEVTGEIEEIRVEKLHADVPVTASFRTDDENVNFYFEAFLRAMRANMHCGIPSDCPHRERLGYTGDGQLISESALLTLDSRTFFEKWLEDIFDCQDRKTGHVQHTAPFNGGGGGPGGWGGAVVLVPWSLYRIHGDLSVLRRSLPAMRKYLSCMESFCEDGLVVREIEGGWCLGDWCTPGPISLPEPFVNTYFFLKCMRLADEAARLIGQETVYSAEIERVKSAWLKAFYDPETDSFCHSEQGADLFALDLGLAGEALAERTYRRYLENPVFDTGIFGTELLLGFLADPDRAEGMIGLLSTDRFPSFGFMKKQGATTLLENWNGADSHDHPMFGGGVKHLFYGLAGVQAAPGFSEISLRPPRQRRLRFIECSLSVNGAELKVRYDYGKDGLRARVETNRPGNLYFGGKTYPLSLGANSLELRLTE